MPFTLLLAPGLFFPFTAILVTEVFERPGYQAPGYYAGAFETESKAKLLF